MRGENEEREHEPKVALQTCWFLRVRVRLSKKLCSCSSSILMLYVERAVQPHEFREKRRSNGRRGEAGRLDAPRDERLGLFCLHRAQVDELHLLVELEVFFRDVAVSGVETKEVGQPASRVGAAGRRCGGAHLRA